MSDFTEIMQSLCVADQKIQELKLEVQRKDARIDWLETCTRKLREMNFCLVVLCVLLVGALVVVLP